MLCPGEDAIIQSLQWGLLDTRAFIPRREIPSTTCSLFGAAHTDGRLAFGIFQARTLQIPSGFLNCISSSPMPGPLDAPVGDRWARPLSSCKHAGAAALGSSWEAAGPRADGAGRPLPPSRGHRTELRGSRAFLNGFVSWFLFYF